MTTPSRVIKRYQNRKLYDTVDSCYVTLEEIADLVRSGDEIRVIDNETQNDLTSVTLAQIIFESEKNRRNFLPIETLKKLVQSGGEVARDFMQRSIETGVKEISHVREEGRKFINTTVRPMVKSVQNIPIVNHELKSLKKRLAELENQLSRKLKRGKKS